MSKIKNIIMLLLIGVMLSCSPRQFKTPTELIEKAKEREYKKNDAKDYLKTLSLFTFFVFGIYQLKK